MISILAMILAASFVAKPAPPADLTAPPADAQKLDNGLVTKQLAPGTGTDHPAATDYVHLRYAVWKASDASVVDFTKTGSPAFVQLSSMLPGMREMLQLMTPGEKRRGWIPSSLGGGKIEEGETFVMDAELVDIIHPPAAPPDVAAPPADATTTPSGLAYKVLRPGTGTRHPKKRDLVTVHYSGWTTDGNMFDSSVMRDEPAQFALDAVIPGWTEGLQLMTEGEKARFWIPAKLAYKNQPGMPAGMLVFDVELIKIR
jgi:peptidylprolyl isomerase